MQPSITRSLLIILFMIILNWSPAYAAKQIATVVAARGDIQALDTKGKIRPLTIQAPIFEDDTIKTRQRSRVQIMFSDNTLINLGNETTMKIAEYRWQADSKDGAIKTQVKEGTFRIMGGTLAKTAPQNFKTETPTATIGIRGSMYAGVVTANFLSVVFQGGKGINVTNEFGTVEISKPGYGTKVTMDKPPLKPAKFTAQELGELNKSLGGNGTEEKKKKDEPQEKQNTPLGDQPPAEETTQETSGGSVPEADTTAPSPADTTNLSNEDTTTTEQVLSPSPLIPLVPNLTTEVVADSTQADLATTVSDTTATTITTTNSLTGNYRIFSRDNLYDSEFNRYYSTFLAWDSGTLNGTLSIFPDNQATIQGSVSSNGAYFYDGTTTVSVPSFLQTFGPYTHPGFTPTASSYNGFTSFSDTLSYNDPDLGPLTMTSTNYVEPSGQFFYNTIIAFFGSAPEIFTGSLIYAGTPSASIPTTGIDTFLGHLIYTDFSSIYSDSNADIEETKTAINYYNKRLIGRSSDNGFQGFKDGAVFFGTMAANGTANVTILSGGDGDYGSADVSATYGTATATLYGSFNQGLAFTGSGTDYSIVNGDQISTWEATGAALRSPTREFNTPYPTSPIAYTGFLVGIADDTSNGIASRIFMNNAASDFAMTVNPTTGVVSGTINATDVLNGGVSLSGLTIGGNSSNSAYVANDDMVAILSGSNLSLSAYGNGLVTAGPQAPEITNTSNDFMTWGYWEIAYTDPYDSSKDHLFASQSFFVTGQQTVPTYITNNLLGQNITGTYDGKAFGVQLDSTGQNTSQLTNGATHLVINFQNFASADAITGTIGFDQATLNINSTASALTSNGFTAIVSSVSSIAPTSSTVNGTFYGPTAEAVGGNFAVAMPNGTGYFGVFGGNR